MAMFPVFLIGFIAGTIAMYLYITYKQEANSEVKVHLLKADIVRLKSDIETLKTANEDLREKLKIAQKNEIE